MSQSKTKIIFLREFSTFFSSPGPYIIIALYLMVTGWFFFSTFFLYQRSDLRNFFNMMPVIFSLTIPAVTMRLFSEEYRSGSYEILGTQPVTVLNILLGKSLSALALTAFMLIPTLSYPVIVSFLGDLDWGPVAGGYLAALFLSASYIAIGVFFSSTTKNQIVAFILSAVACLFLSLIHQMLVIIPPGTAAVIQAVSAGYHFDSISRGIVDSRDILYFLSLTYLFLHAAWIVNKEYR
ncbi:MAG: ABC transporter permease subunit [Spirochaetales bacterium]|jgi:ABC-2 type transport system permease protein|nr:ABC transporter permease subunit [Spirochaetales bacterium]